MASILRSNPYVEDIGVLKRNWGWFLALGIAEIILGTIALGASVAVTLVSMVFFGWLLIIGGVLSVVHAFWEKQWSGFFLDLVTGVLYAVVGFMMVSSPIAAAVSLTYVIAVFLIMEGIFRIAVALAGHFHHRWWILLNGLITLGLGIIIWRQLPNASLWVIGMFIGIDMIVYGWSMVMLSMMAKSLPAATEHAGGGAALKAV